MPLTQKAIAHSGFKVRFYLKVSFKLRLRDTLALSLKYCICNFNFKQHVLLFGLFMP